MAPEAVLSESRARILETAVRLFYEQGYHETGINQIIEESGVAKATFYHHFPSKDDLGLAYVREQAARSMARVMVVIEGCSTPRERFLAPLAMLPAWLEETNFRGCSFQNMMHEFPDPGHPIHQAVRASVLEQDRALQALSQELVNSSSRYAHFNVRDLTRLYMLLMEGAVVVAVLYREVWPIHDALKNLIRHIDGS